MTKTRRIALYAAFFGGFLVTAPAVVFYTAGYRLNWERRELVETGLISVSSVPRGAHVSVDGTDAGERTPAVIGTLSPGDHVLRLTREGYLPWEKRLTVNSRLTTFAHDVLLYLDEAPAPVMAGTVRAVSAPRAGTFALALEEGGWVEIWAVNPVSGANRLLERLPASTASALALRLSVDGSVLELVQGTGKAARTSWLYASTGERLAVPGTDLLWDDPTPDGYVVTVTDGHVRVEAAVAEGMETEEPLPAFETDATTHAWQDGMLAFARAEGLYLYDLAAREETLVMPVPSPVRALAWHPLGTTLVAVDDTHAYAVEIDPRGGHVVTPLFEGTGIGTPWIDERGRTLYVAATIDGTTGVFARALHR